MKTAETGNSEEKRDAPKFKVKDKWSENAYHQCEMQCNGLNLCLEIDDFIINTSVLVSTIFSTCMMGFTEID